MNIRTQASHPASKDNECMLNRNKKLHYTFRDLYFRIQVLKYVPVTRDTPPVHRILI